MSIIIIPAALFIEAFIWTVDWWQPVTITGTTVGIEDLIFSFAAGGVIAVIYEELFSKRLRKLPKRKNNTKLFIIIMLLSYFLLLVSFFVLNIHSFYASTLGMLLPTVIIYIFRKDLIKGSLLTGLFLIVATIPVYLFLKLIDPSYINNWWIHNNLSNIRIATIPIEDLIWFFVIGMFFGPLYEFWQSKKSIPYKKR